MEILSVEMADPAIDLQLNPDMFDLVELRHRKTFELSETKIFIKTVQQIQQLELLNVKMESKQVLKSETMEMLLVVMDEVATD